MENEASCSSVPANGQEEDLRLPDGTYTTAFYKMMFGSSYESAFCAPDDDDAFLADFIDDDDDVDKEGNERFAQLKENWAKQNELGSHSTLHSTETQKANDGNSSSEGLEQQEGEISCNKDVVPPPKKRGRPRKENIGRLEPLKAKPAYNEEKVSRKRGRPERENQGQAKKPKLPDLEPIACNKDVNTPPKKRGRPPKKNIGQAKKPEIVLEPTKAQPANNEENLCSRKRGRPQNENVGQAQAKKARLAVLEPIACNKDVVPPPKKRGRPRKENIDRLEPVNAKPACNKDVVPPPKKRGRPRKENIDRLEPVNAKPDRNLGSHSASVQPSSVVRSLNKVSSTPPAVTKPSIPVRSSARIANMRINAGYVSRIPLNSDPLIETMQCPKGTFTAGYAQLKKGQSFSGTNNPNTTHYTVIKGSVQLKFNKQSAIINEGDGFMIPTGMDYHIKNYNRQMVKMSYVSLT